MPKNSNRETTHLGDVLPRLSKASQPRPAIVSSLEALRTSIAGSIVPRDIMTPAEVGAKLERDRLAELSRDSLKLEADMVRMGIPSVPKLEDLEAQLAAAKAKIDARGLPERLKNEIEAAHASLDAKEAKLDAYGYGGIGSRLGEDETDEQLRTRLAGIRAQGADPGSIVGLADVTPIADTAENGDHRTDPNAG